MDISERIRANEDAFAALFSEHMQISGDLWRWRDEKLPDMYDLNDFDSSGSFTADDFGTAESYQRERGDSFVQLHSYEKQDKALWQPRGYDESEILTLLLTDGRGEDWKINPTVSVKKLSEVKEHGDYLALELENYGGIYGEDFTVRKTKRHCDMALEDNGFEYFFAYIDGKMAGACHTFTSNGVTGLDGLIVDAWARKKYVATTLLAAALRDTEYPFYLHADSDDTPKDMYRRMGFEEIERLYIYNKKI